ncbi:MAG: 50S ribosomal protein L35 [Candidatus Omnitrophota bacterium]
MPKMKTKKSVRKRFKVTKSGKIKRSRSGKSHILTKKSRKRKRGLRKAGLVSKGEARMIKRLLPYG